MEPNDLVRKLNKWVENVIKSTTSDNIGVNEIAIIAEADKIIAEELNKKPTMTK